MLGHQEVLFPVRDAASPRLLFLADSGTNHDVILGILKSGGHQVVISSLSTKITANERALLSTSDVALIDVTNSSHSILKRLEELHAAVGIESLRPRLLCFSSVHRSPQFQVAIEKCGARYVRVGDFALLLDAIQVAMAEMEELHRNGPCFQIVHRYSQGGCCAPGEEVSAILLAHRGTTFQLPLPIAQRLLFNFLADHRRIALDSSQIASGLTGEWFYRDHAANSGFRQVKKIRRPTVKVLIQRIREVLASTFESAKLRFDPSEVLRSCPAQGSRRVLYKLHGDVRWHHSASSDRR
jgi:hypothetical protein